MLCKSAAGSLPLRHMYRSAHHSLIRCTRILRAGAGIAFAVLVTGCLARGADDSEPVPARPASAVLETTVPAADEAPAFQARDAEPRVPLQPGETLLHTFTVNLDADNADEQVIAVHAAPAAADTSSLPPVKVAVLDFDAGAAAYVRSWEALTQAGAARTFDLTLQDLLGDSRVEIVARGFNAAGERTLDAYRQGPDAGTVVGYVPIIAVTARGTIELVEPEPAASPLPRGNRGLPVAIVTHTEDPDAADATAMVRTTYHWDAASGRYQAAAPEPVPGSPATRDSLRELLASDGTAEFESHLAGPWYRVVEPDPSDSLVSRMEIIHFEPEQGRITLFDGDVQEIYVWDVSHRLLAARLGIWVHNELVPSIERTINVEAVTGDEIRVVMKGDDDHYFDGNYRMLDDHARTRLADSGPVRPRLVELNLAGRYRDGTGQSIHFAPPHFTWQSANERVSGTYTAYSLGQPVIVFKVMSTAGVTRELRTYTVDYRERRRDEQLLRSLVLRPARLAITGVTGVGAAALHFEQLAALDAATAQDTSAAAAALAIVITPSPANER